MHEGMCEQEVPISSQRAKSLVPSHYRTNPDLLPIGQLRTNFREIQIKIHNLSFMKMHLKISTKLRPFCPGGGGG